MNAKENYKKLCSFYVSDIHFGAMILPYISKRLEEKNNVYTVFEKDMYKNIERLISNLNLNREKREEIKNIDWNRKTRKKEIKEYINKIVENDEIVLVMGNKKYIKNVNKKIEKHIKKEALDKVTIINCYNIDVYNQNMSEILSTHDGILNTTGERKIEV